MRMTVRNQKLDNYYLIALKLAEYERTHQRPLVVAPVCFCDNNNTTCCFRFHDKLTRPTILPLARSRCQNNKTLPVFTTMLCGCPIAHEVYYLYTLATAASGLRVRTGLIY